MKPHDGGILFRIPPNRSRHGLLAGPFNAHFNRTRIALPNLGRCCHENMRSTVLRQNRRKPRLMICMAGVKSFFNNSTSTASDLDGSARGNLFTRPQKFRSTASGANLSCHSLGTGPTGRVIQRRVGKAAFAQRAGALCLCFPNFAR
jgi:hypothetical protein